LTIGPSRYTFSAGKLRVGMQFTIWNERFGPTKYKPRQGSPNENEHFTDPLPGYWISLEYCWQRIFILRGLDMNAQKTLFDAGPTAKTRDPYSSYLAGDTMQRSGFAKTQRQRVLECLRLHGPATGAELGRLLAGDRYAAHRRLAELERMCLAERVGFRLCKVTGRKCQVWKAIKPEPMLFGQEKSRGMR